MGGNPHQLLGDVMSKENVAIEEKVKVDINPPSMWKVILLNDDVTPMELVVDILCSIFKHKKESAEKIMLQIHNDGSGVAGVYPYEIAEHLSVESTTVAKRNGSPLKIQLEQE